MHTVYSSGILLFFGLVLIPYFSSSLWLDEMNDDDRDIESGCMLSRSMSFHCGFVTMTLSIQYMFRDKDLHIILSFPSFDLCILRSPTVDIYTKTALIPDRETWFYQCERRDRVATVICNHRSDQIRSDQSMENNDDAHNWADDPIVSPSPLSYYEAEEDEDDAERNAAAERVAFDRSLVDDDPVTDPEEYDEDDDDEHHDGGSSAAQSRPFVPSYALASSIDFFTLACRLEGASRAHHNKSIQVTKVDLLKAILPVNLLEKFQPPNNNNNNNESIYPLLRLLLPKRDGHRGNYNVKESKLAEMYALAYDLPTSSKNKLIHFQDPTYCSKEDGVGHFPNVLERVLELKMDSTKEFKKQFQKDKSKGFTVGQVNELLDELAGLPAKLRLINEQAQAAGTDSKNKKMTQGKLLANWLRKLNPYMDKETGYNKHVWGLSPLEHKWFSKIILGGSFHIGLGEDVIMTWYNLATSSLWNAHNSLKATCDKLANPEFTKAFRTHDAPAEGDSGDLQFHTYMELPSLPIAFNNTFGPMCSARTDFNTALTWISNRHRQYQEALVEQHHPSKHALALTHPAFTIETKLDGERQIVHFSRDGVVKIHTRNSNWYSELYSPVLGPPLREAVGKHKFDIVLDGEILAWGGEQIGNQFGLNRTVAKKRREWLESRGLVDDRDKNLHDGDDQFKAMNLGSFSKGKAKQVELEDDVSGADVWLTYVVFDVLYLDGRGAEEFINDTVSDYICPRPSAGSLITLNAMERKKLLYRLIETQENMVEIVDTQVVRPTGDMVNGRDYFRAETPYMDTVANLPAYTVDSIECCLQGVIENLSKVDEKRRAGRSDEEIGELRARKCDDMYRYITEESRLEGIVFKYLAGAYLLGEFSRDLRYWLKIKPDYTDGSLVSDIDLVIIGGYYATGLAKAGMPSAFLVACRDSMNPNKYFPFCRINASSGSTSEQRQSFFESTGYDEYTGDADEVGKCKWFSSKHNHVRLQLPDFITERSFQRSQIQADYDGWKPDNSTYPHVWIHPDNSIVVTVKASEIISATTFPTGVTLRHPRIERWRGGISGDEKDLSSIHCESKLRELYAIFAKNRAKSDNNNSYVSSSSSGAPSQSRLFLAETQALKAKRKRTKRRKKALPLVEVAHVSETISRALEGVCFTLLSGEYRINASPTDCDLAKKEGWYEEAERVSSHLDVASFIKRHGGTVKLQYDFDTLILGGSRNSFSVRSHVSAIEEARAIIANKQQTKSNAEAMRKKAMLEGVIRWEFVYSAVYRWHHAFPESDSTIMQSQPHMLKPNALDYLARPVLPDHCELSQLCRLEVSDEIMIRRALETVQAINDKEDKDGSASCWQYATMTHLPEEDRWVTRCLGGSDCGNMTIFPDVFTTELVNASSHVDLSKEGGVLMLADHRWKNTRQASVEVLASLPLARTMGSIVSDVLHAGITHIVSDLKGSDDVEYTTDQLNAEDFRDPISSTELLGQVRAMEEQHNVSIKFVSPGWIRKRKRSWMA